MAGVWKRRSLSGLAQDHRFSLTGFCVRDQVSVPAGAMADLIVVKNWNSGGAGIWRLKRWCEPGLQTSDITSPGWLKEIGLGTVNYR